MGYSGDDYLTKDSVQARFLQNIVDRVTSPLDDDLYNYEAGNYLQYGFFDWFWRTLLRLPKVLPWYVRIIPLYIFYTMFGGIFA